MSSASSSLSTPGLPQKKIAAWTDATCVPAASGHADEIGIENLSVDPDLDLVDLVQALGAGLAGMHMEWRATRARVRHRAVERVVGYADLGRQGDAVRVTGVVLHDVEDLEA